MVSQAPRVRWAAFVCLACACACLATPGVALAQNSAGSARREARALFREGLDRAEEQRWREAAESFRRSAALVERPSTLFNLGEVLLRLGQYTEAARALDRCLAIADPRRDRGQIERVRPALAEARAAIVTLEVGGVPEGASVLVDGRVVAGVGEARTLAIDPGAHVVEVRAADGRSVRHELSPAPGARERWTAAFPPLAPAGPVGPVVAVTARSESDAGAALARVRDAVTPRRGDSHPSIARNPWLWVGIGAGVVAVIAVVLGVTLGASDESPYAGSTGVLIEAISPR